MNPKIRFYPVFRSIRNSDSSKLTVCPTPMQAQPTPPQTPVSTITWKSAAVAAPAAAVIVPEPQKVTDPRAVVNNIRTNERQYSQVTQLRFRLVNLL